MLTNYGHIYKRINMLNVDIRNSKIADDDDYIIIATDSTGIKVINSGQWVTDKWNLEKRKEDISRSM